MIWYHFDTYSLYFVHKKSHFWHLEIQKKITHEILKLKLPIVIHAYMHSYAKYELVIMIYAIELAIALVIWLETQDIDEARYDIL